MISVQFSSVKSLSHVRLFAIPWTVSHQVPSSIGFFQQEYWSELSVSTPGDLSNPEMEPGPLSFPALANSLPLSHQGSAAPTLLCAN